jgi:DNA invertase Pin-like site-specific DNA recombinase
VKPNPKTGAPTRAAQYVRMSTEHQQYSIANQSDAIAQYANDHQMQIVRTYSDAAKSGLTFQRRKALRALIADVENGSADYSVVLVYDVSRWGRFQDVDESAYYEYLCKRAGISVHYCSEPFSNDGSASAALLKAIKRSMAGEYSRELSAKVFTGQCRIVEAGFRQGGPPGYGLRRLLVDQHGNPKGILKRGELKSIATDRTLQVPGPSEEVQVIRDVFHMFAFERLAPEVIAEQLNQQRIQSETGRPWTRAMIWNIVTNPKYIGTSRFNRKSYRLGSNGTKNPREKWIIRENTFAPIVDLDTFRMAQEVAANRSIRYSNEYLLTALKDLLDRVGRLSASLIDAQPRMPRSRLYINRFGTIYEAYRLVGYDHGRHSSVIESAREERARRFSVVTEILDELSSVDGTVHRTLREFVINGEFTVRVKVAACRTTNVGYRWLLRLDGKSKADITLVARLAPTNDQVLDYFALPATDRLPRYIRVGSEDDMVAGIYRFDDLSFLKSLVRRVKVTEDK